MSQTWALAHISLRPEVRFLYFFSTQKTVSRKYIFKEAEEQEDWSENKD